MRWSEERERDLRGRRRKERKKEEEEGKDISSEEHWSSPSMEEAVIDREEGKCGGKERERERERKKEKKKKIIEPHGKLIMANLKLSKITN